MENVEISESYGPYERVVFEVMNKETKIDEDIQRLQVKRTELKFDVDRDEDEDELHTAHDVQAISGLTSTVLLVVSTLLSASSECLTKSAAI